jgi:hypothetical protein
MLAMASEIFPFSRHNTNVRFPRYWLVNCMRYCNVSMVKVSQLLLPTRVAPIHINVVILRSETRLLWCTRKERKKMFDEIMNSPEEISFKLPHYVNYY